jgi:hypothetical protein
MLRHVVAILVLAGFMPVLASGRGDSDKKTVMPTAKAPPPPKQQDSKTRPKED